jgi:hypothetical protein
MKFRLRLQIFVVAVVIVVIASFVKSCNSEPTQRQLFNKLSMMRADMVGIMETGGRVISYDNNSKTTFARVYLLLMVDGGRQSRELSDKYKDFLLSRGWVLAGHSMDGLRLCKQGASTSLLVSQDEQRIAVGM